MDRRTFLRSAAAAAACLPCAAVPACASSPPFLRGCLWWYSPEESASWGYDGWRRELDEQNALGFDILWLCNLTAGLPDRLSDVEALLNLCERRGVKLIVSTGVSPSWYAPLDIAEEKRVVAGSIRALSGVLGASGAFWAWYVPHEIYFCEGDFSRYVHELYPWTAECCRSATPGKLVTLSPFFILDQTRTFGDFHVPEPDEYAEFWSGLLGWSGIDIVMLQDSGEHFSWVTEEQRRPYFRAMRDACRAASARLWGNVECAEMHFGSIEEYVRVNGRVHHSQAADKRWRPVPVDRLVRKLRTASEFCDDYVTWGYREFCRPSLGVEAAQWYADYRRYYRSQR